jgi:hypothetical protein
MTDLPRRRPGARLRELMSAPSGGWFSGSAIEWPADDPDDTALARYFRDTDLRAGPEAERFCDRLLDGFNRLEHRADK